MKCGKLYDVMGNELEFKNGAMLLESTPCYFITKQPLETVFNAFKKAKIVRQ